MKCHPGIKETETAKTFMARLSPLRGRRVDQKVMRLSAAFSAILLG
jgi:hypothetical protein